MNLLSIRFDIPALHSFKQFGNLLFSIASIKVNTNVEIRDP